ncbi:MAG: phage protease [Alkalilacustris sp.]
MTGAPDTALSILRALDVQGAPAPEWVHLLPLGRINAVDGRSWLLDNPDAVIAAFEANGIDLPVDYMHQNQLPPGQGGPVPAAGWIKEIAARRDGIWGRVEWTDRAAEMIAAKEYRFLSPVVRYDPETSSVLSLEGAGLVHTPALRLTALASRQDAQPDPREFVPVEAMQAILSERNAAQAELARQRVAEKVNKAEADGIISPAMRAWATALCSRDPASFDAFCAAAGPVFGHLFKPSGATASPPPSARTATAAAQDDPDSRIARALGIDPTRLSGL